MSRSFLGFSTLAAVLGDGRDELPASRACRNFCKCDLTCKMVRPCGQAAGERHHGRRLLGDGAAWAPPCLLGPRAPSRRARTRTSSLDRMAFGVARSAPPSSLTAAMNLLWSSGVHLQATALPAMGCVLASGAHQSVRGTPAREAGRASPEPRPLLREGVRRHVRR